MEHAVLLTKQPDNGYTARSLLLPELVVSGDDEASTLAQLRSVLIEVQQHSHIVQIDVPLPDAATTNPWLPISGIFANDPTWDEFQAAIAANRAQLDKLQS